MSSGGTTPTSARLRRAGLGVLLTVLVLGSGFGVLTYLSGAADRDAGSVPSGVPCEDRPAPDEVTAALDSHRDLVARVEAVAPEVTVQVVACDAAGLHAELVVFVPSREASDQVVSLLEGASFRVPTSITNI